MYRVLVASSLAVLCLSPAFASSHREAPGITRMPQVDGTDFYMFRSYESGREGYVTLIANYHPLQDPYGGPNYFSLDPDALYRLHVENTGDGVEDLTFQFRFGNVLRDIAVPAGNQTVSIPLVNAGPIGLAQGTGAQNVQEVFVLQLIRGSVTSPNRQTQMITNATTGAAFFAKPIDHIGEKSLPDYEAYARSFVADIAIPGCGNGRVFVGQRKESFAVNLGETFDLVNIANPLGPEDAERSSTADKNVTSLVLEVPIACLRGSSDVIGGWTTAWMRRNRTLREDPTYAQPTLERSGDFVQVSRLGMPLVNEVVIGLKDKDRFNASRPADDGQFATYVTNPTLPELLEILFGAAGVRAPNNFPRQDLLAAFVTGIAGLNQLGFGEMQRLNLAIAPTPAEQQNRLGVIGGDNAGFPNGRRPGDDVVDIELRVAMGLLCHAFPGTFCLPGDAPSGLLPFTDGTWQAPDQFDAQFPYLRSPIPGSGNPTRVFVAELQGRQEVPPTDATARGACTALVDAAGTSISVNCSHDLADATAGHLHLGNEGANGPVICNLGDPASPILAVCPLTADQLASLRRDGVYVNLHTAELPGGAIRGQLR